MDPEIYSDSPELDFELAALLGEKPAQFIVLHADGEPVPFTGTPYDTPSEREIYTAIVAELNNRTKKSHWHKFFMNWLPQFLHHYKLPVGTTSRDFHPQISFKISRVCRAYSSHLHCAMGLFEATKEKFSGWSICTTGGCITVEIFPTSGPLITEHGADLPMVICLAVKRLLSPPSAH